MVHAYDWIESVHMAQQRSFCGVGGLKLLDLPPHITLLHRIVHDAHFLFEYCMEVVLDSHNLSNLLLPLQAMAVIQRMALSAAIFAPGWVFETQDKSHFFQNQDK